MTDPNKDIQDEEQVDEVQEVETVNFKSGDLQADIPKPIYEAIKKNAGMESLRLKNQLKEYQDKVTEYESMLLNQKDEKKEEPSKGKEVFEMELQKKEKKIKELEDSFNSTNTRYNSMLKATAIADAIGKTGHQLVNAKQVQQLLNSEYKFELVNDNGNDVVIAKQGEEYISVDDAVQSFLNDEVNSHFILSNLKSGSGNRKSGEGQKQYSRSRYTEQDLKDPVIRKEYYERISKGENIPLS